MPQTFIALGKASCRTGATNRRFQAVCGGLLRRLETLRGASLERVYGVPEEGQRESVANGSEIVSTTYRKMLEDGRASFTVR
jgi:hypothetical protein